MAAASNAAHVVQEALAHPYVRRAIEDPEIRDNARTAYASAREAFDRLSNQKQPVSALFDDPKVQNSLKTAGAAFIGVRAGLLAKEKKKRHWGRLLLLAIVGGVLAIALSEGLRNKVLDLLFGAEEEFDYVSTTAPPAAAAPAAPAPEAESAGSQVNGSADAEPVVDADAEAEA